LAQMEVNEITIAEWKGIDGVPPNVLGMSRAAAIRRNAGRADGTRAAWWLRCPPTARPGYARFVSEGA